MNVLIACEFSGTVREAFRKRGHHAVSCDLLPTDIPGPHYEGDIFDIIMDTDTRRKFIGHGEWDLMIAHPPCTHLCSSGARWFKDKKVEQEEAISFVWRLMHKKINKIAIENPIGVLSSKIRKPDQIIQPWQFGHGETKATCLWLKNLPKLVPTNIVDGREARIHKMPPGKDRWKLRSITYQGIADAMAGQWG